MKDRSLLRRARILSVLALLAVALPGGAATAGEAPWANGRSSGEDLRVSLVTFGEGDSIPEWFGHTALLVEDTRLGTSRIYNFGMFDFGPKMLPRFLMGRLEFWVGEADTEATFRFYEKTLNRAIRLQELNLLPARRLEMAKALALNVRPENRSYLYHHYDNNCATRIRDLIDQAIDGALKKQSQGPARLNLREHTRRIFQANFYVNQVLIYWMNDEIDRPITPWEEMFLPSVMERRVDGTTYLDPSGARVPLVKRRTIVARARGRTPVAETPATTWPFMLLLGLLFGAGAVGLSRWQLRGGRRLPRVLLAFEHILLGLLAGLPALVLTFFVFTEHTVTHHNWNNLLANPLTFLAAPLGLGLFWGSPRAIRWLFTTWSLLCVTSLLALAAFALRLTDQAIGDPLAFFVPANLGLAWATRGLRRRA